MSAYIVVIRNETKDPAGMARYAELAPKAPYQEAQLEIIASKTNRFEILEGPPAEAMVIMRFPTWDDALLWYRSPEYQEAIQHRLASGDFRAILIEGAD